MSTHVREILTKGVFGFFAMALLRISFDGTLGVFITPITQWIVQGGTGVLVVMGLLMVRRSMMLPLWTLGVLLVVAVSATFLSPTTLSAEAAKLRTVKVVVATDQALERRIGRSTTQFGVLDWLAILADPNERSRYEGRTVAVTGFYLKQDTPAIGRMVMTCCGADAQPVYLSFVWSQALPPENSWIRVSGVLRVTENGGYVEATDVEFIPEPKNPYAE